MIVEAFAIVNGLQHVCEEHNALDNQPLEGLTDDINDIPPQKHHEALMETMFTKALTLLHEGSSTSMLLTLLLLLNLKTIHGVSNSFMNELFSLLRKELLPKGNKLHAITYEALKTIKVFGLSYEYIYACTNGCVFFIKTLSNVQKCPKCDVSRFVEGFARNSSEGSLTFPFNPMIIMHVQVQILGRVVDLTQKWS